MSWWEFKFFLRNYTLWSFNVSKLSKQYRWVGGNCSFSHTSMHYDPDLYQLSKQYRWVDGNCSLSHTSVHYDPDLYLNSPNCTGELVGTVAWLIQVHTMTLICIWTLQTVQVSWWELQLVSFRYTLWVWPCIVSKPSQQLRWVRGAGTVSPAMLHM